MTNSVVEYEPYTFKCGPLELYKVLTYYGLVNGALDLNEKIICPFHGDVNASMMIDMENGKYFCFGCERHGNALDFVVEVGRLNGESELKSIANYFKILKSNKVAKLHIAGRQYCKRKDNEQLLTMANDYYYGLSTLDWNMIEWDAPFELIWCRSYMQNRGFTNHDLNRAKAKITYNNNYPIVFPMLDNGNFKGWVSRTMDKEIEAKRKYLYNEGFSRATTLVGEYGYKTWQANWCYVVEGYMDMLKLRQFGVENVCAILGWRITREQIAKLKEAGVTTLVSALDNDKCGREGSELLKQSFNTIRFNFYEHIKDPGMMDKKMFEEMKSNTNLKGLNS